MGQNPEKSAKQGSYGPTQEKDPTERGCTRLGWDPASGPRVYPAFGEQLCSTERPHRVTQVAAWYEGSQEKAKASGPLPSVLLSATDPGAPQEQHDT